jgi:diguanylate cyclase (GGDEF)-like protein
MKFAAEPAGIMSTASDHDNPTPPIAQPSEPAKPNGLMGRGAEWLLADPKAPPAEIQHELSHQSLAKPKTLILTVVAAGFVALIAVLMTHALWSYLWLAGQIGFGGLRLLVMKAFITERAAGRPGRSLASVTAGLAFFGVFSAGSYCCVASGQWQLTLMAGLAIASLMGGVASRDAGTPRYATTIIFLLTLPYMIGLWLSPIPYLPIIGLQLLIYACGVTFVMQENNVILLGLHHSESENRRLAQHDLLTGLPNRSFNLKRFDQLLSGLYHDGRLRQEFMVFCLDLDGFKSVNDKYGHAAGDAILVAVAGRLRETVRGMDFVSRIGGDEFVILLPAVTHQQAEMIAQRIIDAISIPYDLGVGVPVRIGVSIGCANAPEDGATAEDLLKSADRALYEAKRRGRGVFVAHSALQTPTLVPAIDADAGMPEASRLQPRYPSRRGSP